MKEEAQIKALAELDGWQLWRYDTTEAYLFEPPNITASILNSLHMLWVKVNKWPEASVFVDMQHVPSYLTDLNAIHELALKLRNKQYTVELRKIVMRDRKDFMEDEDSGITMDLYFYEATAPQRCEAILRATGRWVE